MTSIVLTCIVPFRELEVLRNNLYKSLVNFTSEVEVVLVHDTPYEVKEYELEFLKSMQGKVKYLSGNFNSAAKARNLGLGSASGNWIMFWDSDDYGFAREVQSAIDRAGSNEVVVCGFEATEVQPEGIKKYQTGKIDVRQLVVTPGIWRFIFRSHVVKGKSFPDIPLGEDILFLVSCGAYEKDILISEEIIYEYRLSSSQATRKMDLPIEMNKFLENFLSLLLIEQPLNVVPYGIYVRQKLRLLSHTRGKTVFRCLKDFFYLYANLEASAKRSMRKSFALALSKSRI